MTDNKFNMSLTQYARHRGISVSAVSKAIIEGKINGAFILKGDKKLIDPILADKLWDALSFSDNRRIKMEEMASAPAAQGYAKARAAKETFSAKVAQLQYEQKAGKLCRIDDVKRAAQETARVTRDAILAMPDRLAPVLAAETDHHKIRELLIKEFHNALTNLSHVNWDEILERGKK
jgi:hypothetical protein